MPEDMLEYSPVGPLIIESVECSLSYVRAMQKPLIKCHTDGP